jgi:DNA mismatch endonuclease (patch repair protein)
MVFIVSWLLKLMLDARYWMFVLQIENDFEFVKLVLMRTNCLYAQTCILNLLFFFIFVTMDNRTKVQRSYNMSRIRSTNTKPELLVRKFLFANGIKYRLYLKELAGKPDIVIRKLNSVIFINGCFWHGHKNCKNAKTPVANQEFWVSKITSNHERDKKNIRLLKNDGWRVLVVWECQLDQKKLDKTLDNLVKKLLGKN